MGTAILNLRDNQIVINDDVYTLYNFNPNYTVKGKNSLNYQRRFYEEEHHVYGSWLHLGVFYHFEKIEQVLLNLGVKSILITGVSRIGFFPMWGFLGERNVSSFKNVSGTGIMLAEYLEYNGIKSSIRFSSLANLKVIKSRVICSAFSVAITFRSIINLFGFRQISILSEKVILVRGKAHLRYVNSLKNDYQILLLDGWFRKTEIPAGCNAIRLNHFLTFGEILEVLRSMIVLRKSLKMGYFAGWLPLLQMSAFGALVNKAVQMNDLAAVNTCEVLYPFNTYIDKRVVKILHITTVLPDIKVDLNLGIYDDIYIYDRSLKEMASLRSKSGRLRLSQFREEKSCYSADSKNIVFFVQPFDLNSEKEIIEQLILYCDENGFNFHLQLHPRSNVQSYQFFKEYFISDWRKLGMLRFAATRNSSIGLELSRSMVPVAYFVTHPSIQAPVFTPTERDVIVTDLKGILVGDFMIYDGA